MWDRALARAGRLSSTTSPLQREFAWNPTQVWLYIPRELTSPYALKCPENTHTKEYQWPAQQLAPDLKTSSGFSHTFGLRGLVWEDVLGNKPHQLQEEEY